MDITVDLRAVEAFIAVVEKQSFTAAARALLLSQPSVSARIASLETALGAQLLERPSRRARLTPAGKALLPHARALLRQREHAVKAVRELLDLGAGTLIVGASSVPGSYLLPGILARLHNACPKVRIELVVSDSEDALRLLRRGEIEVAVVGKPVKEQGLSARHLHYDEILLVAAPHPASRYCRDKKLSAEALVSLPLVLRESGSATRDTALTALAKAGVTAESLNIVLEVRGNEAALQAAVAGMGAAFLSRLVVARDLAAGRLVKLPLDLPPLRRPLVLVTLKDRTLSPAAQHLMRLLTHRRVE